MKITVIDYGAGNTNSVENAFKRLNTQVTVSNNFKTINTSDLLVLPGVGHAKAAMDNLNRSGIAELLKNTTLPVLGICLGMQLLYDELEEGNCSGLGIIPGKVLKFGADLKTIHMGWNTVTPTSFERWNNGQEKQYYFVHGFYAPIGAHTTLIANAGREISAAVNLSNYFGVQFHPEKSGSQGQTFLCDFIKNIQSKVGI